ncbi:MAG: hypothetical protein Ct9H300mP11_01070 [Chloroflexota bacterium]|nr:MAG: hypothetical protein Ct9H300mP11_01070 [Chloroflexota bacterium]
MIDLKSLVDLLNYSIIRTRGLRRSNILTAFLIIPSLPSRMATRFAISIIIADGYMFEYSGESLIQTEHAEPHFEPKSRVLSCYNQAMTIGSGLLEGSTPLRKMLLKLSTAHCSSSQDR